MQQTFKKRFWKYSAWFGGLFLVMLVFRLIYGYVSTQELSSELSDLSNYFGSVENLRKNYASEKSMAKTDVGQQASVASGQKYEKTASIKSTSSQFEAAGNGLDDQLALHVCFYPRPAAVAGQTEHPENDPEQTG